MTSYFNISKADSKRGGFRLEAELRVAEPREEVFEIFSDAFQLEELTPPWLHFSVLTPRPIDVRDGTVIDYKLRVRGVPMRWQSRISSWDPPHRFVDGQVKGPYRFWHHLHTFEAIEKGTLIRDEVHYGVPLSFLVHPLVRRDLRQIFDFRYRVLCRMLTPMDANSDSG